MMKTYRCSHYKKCTSTSCDHRYEHEKGPNCRSIYCDVVQARVECVFMRLATKNKKTLKWGYGEYGPCIVKGTVAVIDSEELKPDVWDRLQGMEEWEHCFSVVRIRDTMEDSEDDTNETTKCRILAMINELQVDWLIIK